MKLNILLHAWFCVKLNVNVIFISWS